MNLDFLNNIELTPVAKAAPVRSTVSKNPESADLRLYKNGKVYPSQTLVATENLQYANKGSEVPGNGLDIFSSDDWGMIGEIPTKLLFVALVPKSAPKVSLFGSCTFNEDNTPKSDVMTQGGGKGGKELLALVESTYGIVVEDYVDLNFAVENVITSHNGVYHLPKIISGGARKGEMSYVTRKNISICPLVLADDAQMNAEAKAEEVGSNDIKRTDFEYGEVDVDKADTDTANAIEVVASEVVVPTTPNPFTTPDPVQEVKEPVTFDEAPTEAPETFAIPGIPTDVAPAADPGDDWANSLGAPNV